MGIDVRSWCCVFVSGSQRLVVGDPLNKIIHNLVILFVHSIIVHSIVQVVLMTQSRCLTACYPPVEKQWSMLPFVGFWFATFCRNFYHTIFKSNSSSSFSKTYLYWFSQSDGVKEECPNSKMISSLVNVVSIYDSLFMRVSKRKCLSEMSEIKTDHHVNWFVTHRCWSEYAYAFQK